LQYSRIGRWEINIAKTDLNALAYTMSVCQRRD